MSEVTLLINVENGNAKARMKLNKCNSADLSILITQMLIIQDEIKEKIKEKLHMIEEKETKDDNK